MIRQATSEDVPQIVEIGGAFHAYSPYRDIAYDREAFTEFAGRLVEHGAVFLTEDGMCGGILSPLFFNPSVIVAAELFWWAPSNGRALREAFEDWANEQGAALVQFSALADAKDERMDRLYARAGYRRAETAYVKGL